MLNGYGTIIAADGNEASLVTIKTYLDGLYNIFTVPSSKTLLLLLENVTPDLILLDSEIPGPGCCEIIGGLKKLGKTAHVPVILLTGSIDPEKEETGFAAGAADYLTKPFSRELLLKRIETHLPAGKPGGRKGDDKP